MALPNDLGRGFLRRVRRATVVLGAVGVLFALGYAGLQPGLAAAAGIAVATLNLRLLEELFTRMLRPEGPSGGALVAVALVAKLPLLFGGTALALGVFDLPAVWYLGGFTLPLAVVVLKVIGLALTSSSSASDRDGRWSLPDGRIVRRNLRSRGRRDRRAPGGVLALWICLGLGIAASPLVVHGVGTHAPLLAQRAGEETPAVASPGDPADPATGMETEAGTATDEQIEERIEDLNAPIRQMEGAPEAADAGHGDHPPELPNIILILAAYFPDAAWAQFLYTWQNPIYSFIVIFVLCAVAIAVYRRRTLIPGRFQNAVEMILESFTNFILGILGPRGKEFIPFLGTLFLYIWLNNLQGLVPLLKSPTSVFNTTISLGICVFAYVQYTGLTKLGIGGYLHHLMGSPVGVIGWAMVPLMLPLHLIEEIAKPISLSLRLFGNILGEDVLLGVFAGLGVAMLAFTRLPIGIPLHLPFIFLALLLSTIQALVFTLLATIYFLQMMPHEHEEGVEHGH